MIGAALAGAGGARVISCELDKKAFQATAAKAALEPANPELAMRIATSPAAAVLAAARDQAASSAGPEGAGGPDSHGAVPAGAAG